MREKFENRRNKFQREFIRKHRQYNRIATFRVFAFLLIAGSSLMAFNFLPAGIALSIAIVGLSLFAILIKWHNKVKYDKNHLKFLQSINEGELRRLGMCFERFKTGEIYLHDEHPYTADLDIFGRGSLFQLINRTTSPQGEKKLAAWLQKPADLPVILSRQSAVRELAQKIDWIQDFEALGRHHLEDLENTKEGEDVLTPFYKGLESEFHLSRLQEFARFFLPASITILLILLTLQLITWHWVAAPILVNILILRTVKAQAKSIMKSVSPSLNILKTYQYQIKSIESAQFSSSNLQSMQMPFKGGNESASGDLKKISRLLDMLENRSNLIYLLFNILFLTDLLLLHALDKVRKSHGSRIRLWFSVVQEMEALISLAAFSAANPGYSFPKISADYHQFEATNLGHPLLPHKERICNDFNMKGKGSIALITGSNMSGKSTFLRTVGINTVLALAGAPVCADTLLTYRFQVFSSMRTQDNLQENVSSFYAELRRIKSLLKLLDTSEIPVLFLLDEVLKGTNSHDRHRGAMALIRQLNSQKTIGLVSTHDLELGQLAETHANIHNFHFESNFNNGKIDFPYKLKEGICKSFNASQLMASMGIPVDE